MAVRPARMDDIPRLITYISAFHAETPWSALSLSEASLKLGLQAMILSPQQCIYIHEFGAIGGQLAPVRFSADVLAQEVFWWSERDGLPLMQAFEGWAQDMGARGICMASMSDSRVAKLYARKGYQPAEQFYLKVI